MTTKNRPPHLPPRPLPNRRRHPRGTLIEWALAALGAFLIGSPGCFVKLPKTPEHPYPGLEDAWPEGLFPPGSDAREGGNGYPDWTWWIPDGREGEPDADWNPAEIVPGDGAEVAEEPYVWNCTFPPEEFDSAIRTRSFVKKGQVLGNQDLVIVYQYSCNTDKTYQSPERGYFFAPEEPLELSLRLECDAPCYAYLMRNGCYYDSTEACWFPYGSELTVATDLMPGLYMIGVEFVDADLEPPDAVHHFDLHAALNYVHGDSSCPCASVTSAGTLPPPQCDAGAETGPATQAVSGSLSWAAEDDFFLQCGHLGVAADKIGGMPDVVHAFDADFEGELPRLLDVRVTFPGQPGTGGPGHILALTTAPCGAPEAVIDCAWGSDGVLALEGLTVFPGERLYAVVDGMGADAFEAPAETAYEVQWSLRSPCP